MSSHSPWRLQVKGLGHFQARFKEAAITLEAVMKMNGGRGGMVMVLLKKEKKHNTGCGRSKAHVSVVGRIIIWL